ncbi:flavin reductase [Bradyrhizobium paxllaeri]|uniref:flavin reductase n=1 Tax=Bradyrhizobium paxllaeri TaxID=190148 RepID=UPI0024BF7919|nr:flavin reductase [Bradyrhizobium paxllaeri]
MRTYAISACLKASKSNATLELDYGLAIASPDKRNSAIEAIKFRQAVRNLASGVSIVATGTVDGRRGLTVSSITSICMEPPCLLVGINSCETNDAILANGTLGVSLLGGSKQDLAPRLPAGTAQTAPTVSHSGMGSRRP